MVTIKADVPDLSRRHQGHSTVHHTQAGTENPGQTRVFRPAIT